MLGRFGAQRGGSDTVPTISLTCETELGLAQTMEDGAYANQRLKPRDPGKAQGRNMVKTSNRTWETRPYGIIGGPAKT